MKPLNCSCVALAFVVALSSCVPADATIAPARTKVFTPLPTVTVISTAVSTPTAPIAFTLTPPIALEPHQASDAIRDFFQEPTNCSAPCFWGIIPGQTKIDDAKNIFFELGLEIIHTPLDGKDLYGVEYFFGNGFSSIVLVEEDGIVSTLETSILPNEQESAGLREWLAYSPETLINQYGTPSRVDFFVGRAAPTPLHSMIMYFDTLDLIVEYSGADIVMDMSTLKVCPLVSQVDSVRLWIGRNPQYLPPAGVPLEDASSLTLEEFSELMFGDPIDACFNLKAEKFP